MATMLFMISLHELSACPFRLVDEINQGMDPRNERLVYSYTHCIASQPNCPQYESCFSLPCRLAHLYLLSIQILLNHTKVAV